MGNHQHCQPCWTSVILALLPSRYQCQDCRGQPTTTQVLGWSDGRDSFAYDNHILLQLVYSTVIRFISFYPLGVWSGEETKVDGKIAEIEILDMEIALLKGQGNYVTMVTGEGGKGRQEHEKPCW